MSDFITLMPLSAVTVTMVAEDGGENISLSLGFSIGRLSDLPLPQSSLIFVSGCEPVFVTYTRMFMPAT
jgi:hypothetical protein